MAPSTNIHPSAIVHPNANLDPGVQIGPYCVVEDDVVLGTGTRLDAYAQVKSYTRMGKDNHVHSYACIGGTPQDLKFQGEETVLEIGDRNMLREFVTLNRGTQEGGGVTRVGSDCLLMAYVHVAHDCQLADRVILANAATLGGHVEIGPQAVIGGLCAIHQFVSIGEFAFIGGKSGVAQDVPPYVLAVGSRATMRGLNRIGLKRQGFDQQTIQALREAYRMVFRPKDSREGGLEQALTRWKDVEQVQRLVSFIKSSERGVIPQERGQA